MRAVGKALMALLVAIVGLKPAAARDLSELIVEPTLQPPAGARAASPLRCLAFSPYVAGFRPGVNPPPSRELIAQLLDRVVQQTPFRCIVSYGVVEGLEAIVPLARARGLKVIMTVWLEDDRTANDRSVAAAIQQARTHPRTVIRISCGGEVRNRHGTALDDEIRDCLSELRAAGLSQPLTSIDTWWEWCDRTYPCQPTDLAADVDWIGVNIFPWWENKYSALFPCTTTARAADFTIARLADVKATYPEHDVVITEYGWPAAPAGYRERNVFTGQACAAAGEEAQTAMVRETLRQLDARGWSGVVFEAFREPWKVETERPIGAYWGLCASTPPYACKSLE